MSESNTINRGSHFSQGSQSTLLNQSKKSPKKPANKMPLIIGGILLVLVVLYVAGVIAFHFLFLPNTTLDGQNVSLKLATEVGSSLASRVGTYQARVSAGGLEFTLRGADVGMSFDEQAYEQGVISQQNAWVWPVQIFGQHEIAAHDGATYNTPALRSVVEPLVEDYNDHATKPVNATIAFDDATQSFSVVAEQAGTALNLEELLNQLGPKLSGLSTRITLDDGVLMQPEVTSADESLATAAQNANSYLAANVQLSLGGQIVGEVASSQIAPWVALGDDLSATLDEAKLAEWVTNNIALKYDTVGATRTYTREDGKQITVSDSGHGTYGWITDEAAITSALSAAISSGTSQTIEVATKQTAEVFPDAGGRDWANRYIDIDLSEQHVRMYGDDGALIWESDCVTGKHSEGYDTPTGVYKVNNRARDVVLKGKPVGEPEYSSPVSYWMPFIDNSWGMHDASWRSSFGGTIYLTNGSHGCVNLPSSKAAELYNITEVGDVVVVHN